MKILNFGSLNIDYVYQVPHFLRPGETLSSTGREVFCGGKGLNQSIALARAGAAVFHAGCVGRQDGQVLREALERNGVRTDYVADAESASGHAIIQVDREGGNCILLYGGANQEIRRPFVDQVLSGFEAGDFLLLQNEISELSYIMETAHGKGMRIVLNPSPMNEKILSLPLETVSCFLLNEVEAADLCGEAPYEELLDRMTAQYPGAGIVLTVGKNGVLFGKGRERCRHGIFEVPVVDTTAAGDTFTGYFIASMAAGEPPEKALRIASKASALAVSRRGAEPSIPRREEVLSAFAES